MVDWKQYGFQIAASLVGSSLLVTAVSSWVGEINKPHLSIDVESNPDYSANTTTVQHFIVNNGKTPASNLRLTMSYPGLNIISSGIEYRSENMTVVKEDCLPSNSTYCSTLVAYIPRLAPNAMNIINATVDKDYVYSFEFESLGNPLSFFPESGLYRVVAAYDQGSDRYTAYPSFAYGGSPYNTQLVIIPSVLAFASFAFALRYKRIKESRNKKEYSEFAFKVLKDIIKVQNVLIRDIFSTKILNHNTWESKTDDVKREIFDDYNDYKKLNEVYAKLKKRDYAFLHNEVPREELRNYNKDCLQVANNAANIDWKKFNLENVVKIDYLLATPAIILGSFFITYLVEGGLIEGPIGYSYDILYDLLGFYASVPPIIALIVTRSLAAYFIVKIILKRFQSLPSADREIRTAPLYSLVGLNYRKRKLVILSFAIMGAPIGFLGSFVVQSVDYLVLGSTDELPSGQQFVSLSSNFLLSSAVNLIIDILRLLILVYLVSKPFRKLSIKIKKMYFVASRITATSGILHILLAMLVVGLSISAESLSFGNPLVAIPILLLFSGTAQMFWALLLSKKQGKMWCYLGIAGSTIMAVMWIFAVTVLPAIFNEFMRIPTDYYNSFYSSGFSQEYRNLVLTVGPLQTLIQGLGFVIVSLQIIYIAIATVIVFKQQQKNKTAVELEATS